MSGTKAGTRPNPLEGVKTGADLLQRCRDLGGQASDGPLDYSFVEGWAVHPFANKSFPSRAHYWKREPYTEGVVKGVLYEVSTRCGRFSIETEQVRLLGPGNMKRCHHCTMRLMG